MKPSKQEKDFEQHKKTETTHQPGQTQTTNPTHQKHDTRPGDRSTNNPKTGKNY